VLQSAAGVQSDVGKFRMLNIIHYKAVTVPCCEWLLFRRERSIATSSDALSVAVLICGWRGRRWACVSVGIKYGCAPGCSLGL